VMVVAAEFCEISVAATRGATGESDGDNEGVPSGFDEPSNAPGIYKSYLIHGIQTLKHAGYLPCRCPHRLVPVQW
jgi:hypothetical protein